MKCPGLGSVLPSYDLWSSHFSHKMGIIPLWYPVQDYTGPGLHMLRCPVCHCNTVVSLGNSLLFSGHPLNSPTSQYSPGSHQCGSFSFLGRKAQNDDGSNPLDHHTHGNRFFLVRHLLVIYTPPQVPWPTPHLFPPNPTTGKVHSPPGAGVELTVASSLRQGCPFRTSASQLCNVGVRRVESGGVFSCRPHLIFRDSDVSGINVHFNFRQIRVQISTLAR